MSREVSLRLLSVAVIALVALPPLAAQSTTTYNLPRQFSSTQGGNNWYYYEASGAGSYAPAVWTNCISPYGCSSDYRWAGSRNYFFILGRDPSNWLLPGAGQQVQPGEGSDVAIGWKAPQAGAISISAMLNTTNPDPLPPGTVCWSGASCWTDDGVWLSIWKGGTKLTDDLRVFHGKDGDPRIPSALVKTTTTVAADDMIYFYFARGQWQDGDYSAFSLTISYDPYPDLDPPVSSHTVIGNTLTVSATDGTAGSGVALIEYGQYAPTSDPWRVYSSPVTFSTVGTYKLMYRAIDQVGNVEPYHTIEVVVGNNPVPALASLSPASLAAGSGTFTLTVNGSSFVPGAVVRWNGSDRATTYVSATQLTASIPATDIGVQGTAQVTVFNPAPGGGLSGSLNFTISSPCVYSLSPTGKSFSAGAGTGTVTVSVIAGCVWTAVVPSGVTWVAITAGSGGSGSGTVGYSVAANTGPGPRTATLTIAGLPFTVAQAAPGGVLSVGAARGAPGSTTQIPVTLALYTGSSIDSLSFSVMITPVGNAPGVTVQSFTKDPAMTDPTVVDTGGAPNVVSVGWLPLPTPISASRPLGQIAVSVPASAASGQTYVVHITGVSASAGVNTVGVVADADATLVLVRPYLVGDVAPAQSAAGDLNGDGTYNEAGEFGDGALNILDLILALRAVTGVPGFVPPVCSDRYDATDSWPKDTDTVRGGDGALGNLDLILTLRRVTGVETSQPVRNPRGLACPAQAGYQALAAGTSRPAETEMAGSVEFGEPENAEGGAVRASVYLRAGVNLRLAALSFSAGLAGGWQDARLRFVANHRRAASLVDDQLPGKLAVAWLDGFWVNAGERVLLGVIEVAGPQPDDFASRRLRIYGVSANRLDDGRAVRLSFPVSRAAVE